MKLILLLLVPTILMLITMLISFSKRIHNFLLNIFLFMAYVLPGIIILFTLKGDNSTAGSIVILILMLIVNFYPWKWLRKKIGTGRCPECNRWGSEIVDKDVYTKKIITEKSYNKEGQTGRYGKRYTTIKSDIKYLMMCPHCLYLYNYHEEDEDHLESGEHKL